MINGNIINGNTINGDAGKYLQALVVDNLSVYENLSFSTAYNRTAIDAVDISEELLFYFNKGLPESDSVQISEVVDIVLGVFSIYVSDDPVEILESTSFDLQKEVLMNDFLAYYLNLLIIQYRNKPKAAQHMTTLIKAGLIDLMPSIVRDAFDLETASGAQLDVLGKYIGVSRRVKTFSSDVTLDDYEYRQLLKIKRSTNVMGSSFYEIQLFVQSNLSGIFKAFDHADMSMSAYLNSSVISNTLAQAIIEQDILPKPMGVSYAAIVYLPTFDNIFSLRSYTLDTTGVGFNSYTSYHSDYQFLNYEDVI